MIFGEQLRRFRNEKGLTQQQVGELLGRSKNSISQFERGERQPDLETFCQLVRLFETSADAMLGLAPGSDAGAFRDAGRGITYLPVYTDRSLKQDEEPSLYHPIPAESVLDGGHFFYIASEQTLRGLRILDGDLLLVREAELPDGKHPSLLIADGETLLRMVQVIGSQWVLIGVDGRCLPKVVDGGEVRHIGIVRRVEFEPCASAITPC